MMQLTGLFRSRMTMPSLSRGSMSRLMAKPLRVQVRGQSLSRRTTKARHLRNPRRVAARGCPVSRCIRSYCPLATVGACAGAASERAIVAQLVPAAEIH
jgi:hypothetical protein